MALRTGSWVTGFALVWVFFGLSACTFYPVYSDKYFPCNEEGECPYGNCVCFNSSICVPPDEQGSYADCWPCETVEDCDDSDNCTLDKCESGHCKHVIIADDCRSCVESSECDDGDPETSDFCLPEGICQNLPLNDPVCLHPIGTLSSPVGGMGQSITADGSFVYLGLSEGFHGVQIVDVGTPGEFFARGTFDTNSSPANLGVSRSDVLGLDVSGSHLYLATFLGGLVILDVSNPDEPFYLGGLKLASESWGVQVVDNLAYVARHPALDIIDVSDETYPVVKGSIEVLGRTQDVHVVGELAYLASWAYFQVVNVSDPTAPVLLSELDNVEMAYEVWANPEGYAFLALKTPMKLKVIDATDPQNPFICYTSEPGDKEYRGIDGWNRKIFVATGTDYTTNGGIRVYDVQNPCQPLFESESPTEGPAFEVRVVEGKVYAAVENGSLTGYKVSVSCP